MTLMTPASTQLSNLSSWRMTRTRRMLHGCIQSTSLRRKFLRLKVRQSIHLVGTLWDRQH
jgi:hypothetical protein